ncbi:PAS domain-containing protein [Fusibacter tunisiensis]|uniref:DUF438 domain-containing protein n=1 Tax=Fusibacter tunisiensis TaxID=1008308 RepID=A0ABS2MRU7_9FIRM|nr:PAS domain-containing protein [Fusibacter tunisiensis]MBM7562114.1 DUF438 domain-containing protein [Fusibacter tunisiensis]
MKEKRIGNLIEYVSRLARGEDGKTLYDLYRSDIDSVEPNEAFEIFHNQLSETHEAQDVLIYLDKVINVFFKSFSSKKVDIPDDFLFLKFLESENSELLKLVEALKTALSKEALDSKKAACLEVIKALKPIEVHFQKKENILFPFLERIAPEYTGVTIMWALHNDIRNLLKTAESTMIEPTTSLHAVNDSVAKLIFALVGLEKKERLILFPTVLQEIDEKVWPKMHQQSFDYGFAWIEEPIKPKVTFDEENGQLEMEEILMIFDALPVDLTFVDADNKVKFFSKPEDRIFPRSSAVIGRDVAYCHPPQSVHVVTEILEAFRSGSQDKAEFWIEVKGKHLHIRYFAIRDSKGTYKGTLEVSQDITEIKALTGQRRLLEWSANK